MKSSRKLFYCVLTMFVLMFISNCGIGIRQNSESKNINSEMTKKIAESFVMISKKDVLSKIDALEGIEVTVKKVSELVHPDNSQVLGHVVELNPKGFIVVSGNKNLRPIIAYSFRTEFPFKEDPENMLLSLLRQDLFDRIRYIPLMKQENVNNNMALWDLFSEEEEELTSSSGSTQTWPSSSSTGGWVQTTWKQGDPYNKDCPIDPETKKRSVTGCVATAMSMIMDYWSTKTGGFSFNDFTTAKNSYTTSKTDPSIHIDSDAGTYDFPTFDELNNDLNQLSNYYSSGGITDNQSPPLLFACGVSLEMNYSSSASSSSTSNIDNQLKDQFNYVSAKYFDEDRSDFYTTWIDNMKNAQPIALSIAKGYKTDADWGSRNSKNNVGFGGKGQWMADVNGDGNADYVYNRDNKHEYWVMLSNGKDGFDTDKDWGSRNSKNNVGFSGKGQWMADVNGDGKSDYVYNRDNKHEYWVMLSNGKGFDTDKNWGSRNSKNNVGFSGKGQWMADVNGDGKLDYVYNRDNKHEYWVMLSNGSGFDTDKKWGSRNSNNNVGFSGKGQWMADVNGDGMMDYVYNRDNKHEYWVMLSNGSGFDTDKKWGSRNSNNNVGFSGKGQWMADVNGDGMMDYVYNRDNKHEYWVMLSNGSGFDTDADWGSRNSNNNVGFGGDGQWMTDKNGDGMMDYVYNRASKDEYWVMLSDGTRFLPDRFAQSRNSNNNVGFGGKGQWMADVNGDGKSDYVYNRDNKHEYWVMLSLGDGGETGHCIVSDGFAIVQFPITNFPINCFHLNFGWGPDSPKSIATCWWIPATELPADYYQINGGVLNISQN
jgi:predicted secreted protein